MLPGSRFIRLLLLVLLAGAFMAFDGEHAEAEEALASWYGPGFAGKPTASGEIYDPNGLTAAHKTLPLGTEILVSYGDRTVPVTINDRGPFTGNRELDLSQGAARELGLTQVGVDYVDWTLADPGASGLPQQAVEQPAPSTAQQPGLVPAGTEAEYAGYPRSYPPAQEVAPVGGTYTVQPGDTLASIAAQSGVSLDDLAASNGITDPNFIYSGQALYLPLLLEDPSAGGQGTSDGAVTQGSPNLLGGAPGGGESSTGLIQGIAPPILNPGATVPIM